MHHLTQQFTAYMGALLLTCALGSGYVILSTNVAVKRIVLPITMCAFATFALAGLWQASLGAPEGRSPSLWPFAVILIASLFIMYRGIKFCSRCGNTCRGTLLAPARFCSKCG